MYQAVNVSAANYCYVKVFINGAYMGLYLNVEQIDDEFLDRRYGNDTKNLYKCAWGSSLELDNDIYNNSFFELETNKLANHRSILQDFINFLNKTSQEQFDGGIDTVLNVPNAIRFLAVEALIGHWDGYAYNQNNFY
ncbi:MAG: spore coat protein H, partial [Bacteroidia bacterium]